MNETKPVTAAPAAPHTPPARPAAGPERTGRQRAAELLQRQGVLAVLLIVVIAASFIYPTFASLDNARGVTTRPRSSPWSHSA